MKHFIRKHSFAVPIVVLLVIGSVCSAIIWNATRVQQVATAAPPVGANAVSWTDTTAAKSVDQVFAALPKDWTPRGNQLQSVTPPFPLSCLTDGLQPSHSVSQQFNNGLTVSVSSYTAGAGAVAMAAQIKSAGKCVNNDTYVTPSPVGGIGVEASAINVRRNGATSQTTVFRRGDLIGYVLSDGGSSIDAAKAVDAALEKSIAGKCINEASTPADAARSLWTGVTFTGWQQAADVTIPKRNLPPVAQSADYQATPIPADVTQVAEYTQPSKPVYPVWPLMPAAVQMPTVPKAPELEASVKASINIRVPDDKGPGCGWDFTGTVSPSYDSAAVDASNNDLKTKAVADLNKRADDWASSVTAYWKSVKDYRSAVDAYNKYRDDSNAVAALWAPIGDAWNKYQTQLADYNAAVAAHDDFVAQQTAASKKYDDDVNRCNTPDPVESPSPSASPSPSPSSSPSGNATPSPSASAAPQMKVATQSTPMTKAGCPASRPAILDQQAPTVPTKPVEPPNPIPADKR